MPPAECDPQTPRLQSSSGPPRRGSDFLPEDPHPGPGGRVGDLGLDTTAAYGLSRSRSERTWRKKEGGRQGDPVRVVFSASGQNALGQGYESIHLLVRLLRSSTVTELPYYYRTDRTVHTEKRRYCRNARCIPLAGFSIIQEWPFSPITRLSDLPAWIFISGRTGHVSVAFLSLDSGLREARAEARGMRSFNHLL